MDGEGRLFFAIGVDIDEQVEADFNEWYNADHLPTVVGCPGFVRGCRYMVEDEGLPRYWAIYEVESKEALRTPELRAISGFRHFEPHIRNQQLHWVRSRSPMIEHVALGGHPE